MLFLHTASFEIFSISSYTKKCSQKFTDHLNAIWYWLQVTEATNGFTFQIINSWMESWPGLTVIPPSETWELIWAIFTSTTLFSSWNMVLQPTAFGTERSQQAFISKFFITCTCSIKVRQLQLAVFYHKRKTLKIFFRNRDLNVLKNFLFPATDFERDNIPTKIWFPSGIK